VPAFEEQSKAIDYGEKLGAAAIQDAASSESLS
jgi:hypothetical protein